MSYTLSGEVFFKKKSGDVKVVSFSRQKAETHYCTMKPPT